MNAKLPGVHAPIMQLGTVDDEYSIALNIAFGGRLAHIVVDDTHSANIAMELLTSSRAGRATFIPLNKLRKAPNRLNLPKDKGVIDFAINLVDFDDVYLDAFYYAVGETLIVEDALTAEKLIGRYRMVTLELEEKLTKERIAYSNASTEYSKSRIELNNMVSQFNNSQGLLEEKQKFITENEPNIKKLNSELDKIEVKRVELADKIQTSQDRLSELDNLLGDKNLAELKEKTQGIEDDIRKLQDDKLAINTEINGYDGKIKFNESLIETKKSDIENSINNNKELELSINRSIRGTIKRSI